MEVKIKKIELPVEVAYEIANLILDTEGEDMGNDETVGEFHLEIEKKTTLFDKEIELMIFCSGKIIRRYVSTTGLNEQPSSDLVSQYINNIDIAVYLDSEDFEFNSEEITEKINKLVTE